MTMLTNGSWWPMVVDNYNWVLLANKQEQQLGSKWYLWIYLLMAGTPILVGLPIFTRATILLDGMVDPPRGSARNSAKSLEDKVRHHAPAQKRSGWGREQPADPVAFSQRWCQEFLPRWASSPSFAVHSFACRGLSSLSSDPAVEISALRSWDRVRVHAGSWGG